MVARNFTEVDSNILLPRVDETNGETGIIGMEFPLMNYIHAMISSVFGYTHWYSRLINLIITSIGLYFFWRLLKRLKVSDWVAFFSTMLLISSIWFRFARKTMPDTFCISLAFIGTYYAVKYLQEGKKIDLLWYVLFFTLGMLSKIPAGIYLGLVWLLALKISGEKRYQVHVIGLSILPLLCTYLWYFYWNPHLSEVYGNWYNNGKLISEGFIEILNNMGSVLKSFYKSAFSGFIASLYFVSGVFLAIYKREKILLYFLIGIGGVFLIYMFKSGYFFYHHSYYIIPFVPVMALFGGYLLSMLPKRMLSVSLLSIAMFEGIANQYHDFIVKEKHLYKLELADIVDNVTAPNDLIIVNGNDSPQMIYFSHRKGWSVKNHQLFDEAFINDLKNDGAKFIVVDKHVIDNYHLKYSVTFENIDVIIYQLKD